MTMNDSIRRRKSLFMFIASMLIFGTIGVFRRYIPLSSGFLTFSRGLLGGLFMLCFTLLKRRGGQISLPFRVFARLAAAGACIGVNWILLFEAYNHTTIAVATLCYYMQPTIVTVLSCLLFKERMTWKKAACAFLSLVGMALISGVLGGGQGGDVRGVLLGLGAAAFYAAVVIQNKRLTGIDPYQKTTVQLLSAGLVMVPYLAFTGGFAVGDLSLRAVLLLAAVGIVHTGIAYALYFAGMEGMKLQSIAMFSYIDPVSALLFSFLLLREPLSLSSILGAALILGSAAFSEGGS